MPIKAISGLPRHGKSYNAIKEVLLFALAQGRCVVTNIPLVEQEIRKHEKKGTIIQFETSEPIKVLDNGKTVFNPLFFSDYERFPKGALFLLDEVTRFWPAGLKAESMHIEDRNFFTEHGHNVGDSGFTTEIFLIVQDLEMIARFVRNLVEETWIVTKMKRVGLNKRYNVDVWPKARLLSKTGGKPDNSWQDTYDPKVEKMYISHTKNDSTSAGIEKDIRSTTVMPKALTKIAIQGLLGFGALWFISNTMGFNLTAIFGSDEPEQPAQVASASPQPLTQDQSQQQTQQPKITINKKFLVPVRNETLIIVGFMQWDTTKEPQYLFSDETGNLLTSLDLQNMGYKIEPIDNCLANITDAQNTTISARCSLMPKSEA